MCPIQENVFWPDYMKWTFYVVINDLESAVWGMYTISVVDGHRNHGQIFVNHADSFL